MSIELGLLGQILLQAEDPDVMLDRFAEQVALSPQLSAEVVRIANSPLYGMGGKIRRLDRATLILGVRSVAEIASGVLMTDRARNAALGGALGHDALWLHSLEIAACAQLVTRWLGERFEREAYLAGLLHDLGIPDGLELGAGRYRDVLAGARRDGAALAERERDAFGEDHAKRMRRILLESGFPEVLADAIGHHHDHAAAPELARPIARSLETAHAVLEATDGGWTDAPPDDRGLALLDDLGLNDADLTEIRDLVTDQVKEISAIYGP